jgi:hypothetical protein
MTQRRLVLIPILLLAALLAMEAQDRAEPVNLEVVHRIRQEASGKSQVMDHVFQLTDVVGHRLTNSPGYFAAAKWVEKQMNEWGIEAHQEAWGPFGRGWDYTNFTARMTSPVAATLIGVPKAWTPGTNGKVKGEVMVATIQTDEDIERYRGRLKGKILFMGTGRELALPTTAAATRRTDQELQGLIVAPAGGRGRGAPGTAALNAGRGRGGDGRGGGGRGGPGGPNDNFNNRLNKFLVEEGVLVVVGLGNAPSEAGNVFVQAGGSRDAKDPLPPPSVALTPEHYNRVLRLLDAQIPVTLEFEIETQFYDERTDSVNVVAEIPGRGKRDQIVMIGAHLDSWHGGTGATDNAAGCAVMIEAMRILKQLNLPMDRTVRMGLWGGEEQGLFGSRAYVDQHFSERNMRVKSEHGKLSAYFNVDNGTGKIRGIYIEGNDQLRPVFQAWLAPFADMGATTVSIRGTTGTDHENFNAVGLPAFQFIQDPVDYNSRTHHSNMDVYDRVQREDLQQIAAVVASFVYHAATRDELLPRKPLPPPSGRGGKGADKAGDKSTDKGNEKGTSAR